MSPMNMLTTSVMLSVIAVVFSVSQSLALVWGAGELHYTLCDTMSCWTLVLTLWCTMLVAVFSIKTQSLTEVMMYMLVCGFCAVCFVSNSMIFVYMFFESVLIPMFIAIKIFGYQPERIQAGLYMFMYTVICSLPLLLCLVWIYTLNSSPMLFLPSETTHSQIGVGPMVMVLAMMGFLVKMPVYFLHYWLPKAHVEAPTMGSVILAALVLKLGGYAMFRFLSSMCPIHLSSANLSIICAWVLMGGVISGLYACFQSDIKSVVAYSSVAHMSLSILPCLFMGVLHEHTLILVMVSHGFTSALLFMQCGSHFAQSNSRSTMSSLSGSAWPALMSLVWVVALMSNMSVPPSLNLWGELLFFSIMGLLTWASLSISVVLILIVGIYNILLVVWLYHGSMNKGVGKWTDTQLRHPHAYSLVLCLAWPFILAQGITTNLM